MAQVDEDYIWLTKHGKELDKYAGKWVALGKAGIIAVADKLTELAEKPEVKKAAHPSFFLVPRPEEAVSIL